MTHRTRPRLARACLVACFGFAAAALVAPAFAQEATAPPRTVQQTVNATATITGVDKAKRTFTLKDENGKETTITAGPELARFDEFAVGDKVHASYTLGLTADLRPPTEEEKKEPFLAVEGGGRAPGDARTPAAGAGRMFRIVATIEALDRTNQTATLKGPNGNYMTVQVADPALLSKPRIGDTVVVTASESVAVSLEKAK